MGHFIPILNRINSQFAGARQSLYIRFMLPKKAVCPIGKVSFGKEKLQENLNVLVDAINKAKPAAAKGTYMRSIYLSSTMGPGIRVNPLKF